MLTVFAILAAWLGMLESPRVIYFSSPQSGFPSVLREFRSAVRATLDARSFLVGGFGNPTYYQSPNRVEQTGSGGSIVIGDRTYIAIQAVNSSVTKWGMEMTTVRASRVFGLALVRSPLLELLPLRSVRQEGSGFVAENVIPASQIVPAEPGQILLVVHVGIQENRVTSVRTTAYGFFPWLEKAPQVHIQGIMASSLDTIPITYSKFNDVPVISPPPIRTTVALKPCKCAGPREMIHCY